MTFDLENAIRQWRDVLRSHSAFDESSLAELEDHLREAVAELSAAGAAVEQAFTTATRRLGTSDALAAEFAKLEAPVARSQLRWMTMGILALLTIANVGGMASWLSMALTGRAGLPLSQRQIIIPLVLLSGFSAALYGLWKLRREFIERSWLLVALTVIAVVSARAAMLAVPVGAGTVEDADALVRAFNAWTTTGEALLTLGAAFAALAFRSASALSPRR
jgi:hypothetical protein